jgi:hypothetical protein
MGQLGDTLGNLLKTAADAIAGLFSGLLGAFSAAVGDLAAVVPGGAIGILIVLIGAIAFRLVPAPPLDTSALEIERRPPSGP